MKEFLSECVHGPAMDGDFPTAECDCGDQFLIAVEVRSRHSIDYYFLEWSVIVATEEGWDDANGESWGAWSTDDISYWMKLPNRVNGHAKDRQTKPTHGEQT